jgi:mRNA deadenylase 3'-5' endonuclease subunit Ccr4
MAEQEDNIGIINIATYNVLSKPLANPEFYSAPDYKLEDLDYAKRLPKILNHLKTQIDRSAIICLQEVDCTTLSALEIFFHQYNYRLITASYGFFLDGYMGVSIAIPQRYSIVQIDRYRIVDGKPWPKLAKPSSIRLMITAMCKAVNLSWFPRLDLRWKSVIRWVSPPDNSAWIKMSNKGNFLLSCLLESNINNSEQFIISTVHMPLEYQIDSHMITYTTLIKQRLDQLTRDWSGRYSDGTISRPELILAGDFNCDPKSHAYQTMTVDDYINRNQLNRSPMFNNFPLEDTWRPTSYPPYKSMMKRLYGTEPEYSCCTKSIRSKTKFIGLLDYVFFSNGLTPIAGQICNPDGRICPNSDEPSDHLMLTGSLRLSHGDES